MSNTCIQKSDYWKQQQKRRGTGCCCSPERVLPAFSLDPTQGLPPQGLFTTPASTFHCSSSYGNTKSTWRVKKPGATYVNNCLLFVSPGLTLVSSFHCYWMFCQRGWCMLLGAKSRGLPLFYFPFSLETACSENNTLESGEMA